MILYTVFDASLFTTTIGTQYDDYRNHTTIIGTTNQSQKYVFFRKFDVFHGKHGCDCEDKTYSNCYVLKYSQIDLSDNVNPLCFNLCHYKLHHYWYTYPSLSMCKYIVDVYVLSPLVYVLILAVVSLFLFYTILLHSELSPFLDEVRCNY